MKDDTKKIIDKIRKLFAMAEHAGSNEQEAATATRQAEALFRKHNLSQTDITPEQAKNDVKESVMAKYKWTPGRAPVWAQALAISIADTYDTFVVWRQATATDAHVKRAQQHLTFVGGEADIIVSAETFNYLFITINRLCDEHFEDVYIPPTKGKTYKNSFREGMMARFKERFQVMAAEKEAEFQAAAQTGTSLVIIKKDAISEYLGKPAEYSSQNRQSSYDGDAFSAGYQKGDSVSLNKQLH